METFCAAALEEGGQATGHDAAGGGGGRGARGAGGGSGSTVLGCLQGSTHRAGFGADCLGAVKAATAVQLSDMRADSALYSACAAYAEARCPEQRAAPNPNPNANAHPNPNPNPNPRRAAPSSWRRRRARARTTCPCAACPRAGGWASSSSACMTTSRSWAT